jgi:outer membrane protein assembly factor BamB
MKKYNLFLSTLIILLISCSNLFSQDWTQFRGIGRDSKVTGFKVPKAWPAELKQIWKISVGTGDATPVLSGKRIYLAVRQGTDEVILCLDAETGKEIWRSPYPAPAVTGPSTSHPGPRSSPALSDGKLVTLGVSGILSCLDAGTGKLLWRKENPENAVPQFFTGMSPLITDGLCIVHLGTKDKGQVVAFDLTTGKEKWKWEGDGPAYASPSLMVADGSKHIIVQTEKNLMALSQADGKLQWQIPTPAQQRFYNCTSPYINGQIIYYTGQGNGTKAIQVSKEGDRFVTKELWSNPEIGAKWNTPVLKDGFLYGFTDQRRIYCIDASTGKTAWYDNAVNSDFATVVDCGQVIIGFPSTGNLIVLKPDPKAYTEIAKYKVSETPVYAFPVIAGNIIYVKDAESLMMYRVE